MNDLAIIDQIQNGRHMSPAELTRAQVVVFGLVRTLAQDYGLKDWDMPPEMEERIAAQIAQGLKAETVQERVPFIIPANVSPEDREAIEEAYAAGIIAGVKFETAEEARIAGLFRQAREIGKGVES